MNKINANGARWGIMPKIGFRRVFAALLLVVSIACILAPISAQAQTYRFETIKVQGNQRIETATIQTYAGITRGQSVSSGALNDAYQRIIQSGLFQDVSMLPRGRTLIITVQEFPTINQIKFEGNARIKDEILSQIIQSRSRHVYNPSIAETDAANITEAYNQAGRYSASVTPKIIRRSKNRVDLVFEVVEGKVTEIERISFIGNRAYSDRRLRRVLGTKQAGLLRAIIQKDTFIADRLEFDKQILRDFYQSRGYVDFQVLSVNSEIARERDGFFITFNIREGQKFKIGQITTVSDLPEVDAEEFQKIIKVRSGKAYTPTYVETTIARIERLAIRKGLNFIRVKPEITRNDRDLTLDIEFVLIRGPRIFVERIDIEGNATTLDRVVRRQFKVVEGDPFNPRQIRESAERIRRLGFFSKSDVKTREGTSQDKVIIDVDIEEQPTGSLGFGVSYGSESGAGITANYSERNFLGRGQALAFSINTTKSARSASFSFTEPGLLGRELRFRIGGNFSTTSGLNSTFNTRVAALSFGLQFPVSENGRLEVSYDVSSDEIYDLGAPLLPLTTSPILIAEQAQGQVFTSAIGYRYSFDTRRTGLNPSAGIVLRFGQDFAGLGGEMEYITSKALVGAQAKVINEEVTLRANFEFGVISSLSGTNSRINSRFFLSGSQMRGFESRGIGPRNGDDIAGNPLGGNKYAVVRFDAEFPLGLPEEYGIGGGLFLDIGTVWGLDDKYGSSINDDMHIRSAVGVSILWDTAIGPLRFNFSKTLQKETYDRDRSFEFTIQSRF